MKNSKNQAIERRMNTASKLGRLEHRMSTSVHGSREYETHKKKHETLMERYDRSFREGKIPPHARGSSKVLKGLRQ